MKSRKKLIAGILVATIALTGVLIGAAAVSAANENGAPPGQSSLMARVAEILGINQSDLESAFNQALQEQRDQRQEEMQAAQEARLQELIDQGVLTQEQVDQYKAWLAARPDNSDEMKAWMESRPDFGIESGVPSGPGMFGGRGGAPGMHRGPMGRMPGFEGQCPGTEDTD